MSRARENADGARLDAPLASPAFTGTPTGITAAHLEAGVLPAGVTGGSGLTALGTVTEGTLSNAVVLPTGAGSGRNVASAQARDNLTLSTTEANLTGLTVTMTPKSASSKFLIHVYLHFYHESPSTWQSAHMRILRTPTGGSDYETLTTANYTTDPYNHAVLSGGAMMAPYFTTWLDVPNTGTELTYQIQAFRTGASTGHIQCNRHQYGHIIVQEIG